MTDPEVRLRKSRRFSWAMVPERTLQEIVIAIDAGKDASRTREKVCAHDRAQLEALAEQNLGRPPKATRVSDVTPALLRAWLDEADDQVIKDLYLDVHAWGSWGEKKRSVAGKPAQIEFIRSRARGRQQLKKIVFRAFVASCKKEVVIEVCPGEQDKLRGPIVLAGVDEPRAFGLYEHQERAQQKLTALLARSERPARALIVLPTGAGKTDTVVDWTLDRMAAEDRPRLRILWIAHQRELLDQAAGRYRAAAARKGSDFSRLLRVVHGAASQPSALGGLDVDIVLVSIQSIGARHDKPKRTLLRQFLKRPTIVVVDEAHHAGASSYERVLDELERQKNLVAVIGLTATPRATAPEARVRIRARFGDKPLIKVEKERLIEQQILARPRVTTVHTDQRVEITAPQARRALRDDFDPDVLRQFANQARDELVAKAWLDRKNDWGRTLAFATSIDHAESMTAAFKRAGVDARALHSEVSDRRGSILNWFRETDDAVLVSVGMLTEGVDLPAARTAFLARPTASHILLEQMQGRVLRGHKAGGDREAHIVYFHDLWAGFADVAYPRADDDEEGVALRRKRSLHGVPVNVVAELERLLQQETVLPESIDDTADEIVEGEDEDVAAYHHRLSEPRLVESRLFGYYDLGDEQAPVPVLAHHADGMARLLNARLDRGRDRMPTLMSFFDDAHPPLPSYRALNALVDYVNEFDERPQLKKIDAVLGPSLAADEIHARGDAITVAETAAIIKGHYETLAGVSASSPQAFEAAVRDELEDLRACDGRRQRIEAPVLPPMTRGLPLIPRGPKRDLEKLLRKVARTARDKELLKPSQLARLGKEDEDLPGIAWTRNVQATAFGWWTREAPRRGTIKINRVLMGPKEVISDELLEFLIWHELLHDLLPGQGHRPPFREFESLWPRKAELDYELDTLRERYNLRPSCYPRATAAESRRR